jgi:DNA helicase HerA-like ATPase
MSNALVVAKSGDIDISLLPELANRHGCITGATGTGKTVTLQRLAELFSAQGVPVFMADIKGDLTGISAAGSPTEKVMARLAQLKLPEHPWRACPVTL